MNIMESDDYDYENEDFSSTSNSDDIMSDI